MRGSPLIDIFCEGNEKVGYGHVRRSLTLAAQLRRDGAEVRVSGLSESASRMLPPSEQSAPVCDRQVAVFDSPLAIDTQIRDAQADGRITVALDWFGDALPDVNIAVYPHAEVRAARHACTGFDYVLVREEIAALAANASGGNGHSVLIFLGGGDLLEQGHAVACLLRDQGCDVTLVQGPLARRSDAGDGYRVLLNPPELPRLLASCDWAVTNGGGCFFEALCMGKAAYVLPQSDAERKIADAVEERGAVLGIGMEGLRRFHAGELAPVMARGAELVDGRGAQRVSGIIRGLL